MKNRTRAILGGTFASALIGAGALFAAPAQAAPQAAPIPQARHCTDEGGVLFEAELQWNYTYTDTGGNNRASVSSLSIGTDEKIEDGIDYRLRVYTGRSDGSLLKIQDSNVDGAEENPIHRNPRNPLNFPGLSKVTVLMGVDNDGLKSCKVTFLQPELGTKPV